MLQKTLWKTVTSKMGPLGKYLKCIKQVRTNTTFNFLNFAVLPFDTISYVYRWKHVPNSLPETSKIDTVETQNKINAQTF